MSLQDQLLAVSARRTKTIDYRGVKVHLRELTFTEIAEYRRRNLSSAEDAVTYLLQRTVVDEKGEPALTEEAAKAIANGGASLPAKVVEAISTFVDEEELKKD